MAEPWLIYFFACNREMQPFSFFFCWLFVGGGGDLGSGSGSKFNRAARVGSGRVRQSRVRAGFGLQFWARADLYWEALFWVGLRHPLMPYSPESSLTRQTLSSLPALQRPDVAECPAPGLSVNEFLKSGVRLVPIWVTLLGSHMCFPQYPY